MNRTPHTHVSASGRGSSAATIEIGLDGRSEALDLAAALIPFHSFMVQHARERWVVHARVPGCHGESLGDLVTTIDQWGANSGVSFTCMLGDESAELVGKHVVPLPNAHGRREES